jgi:hypothetical protein
LTLSTLGVDSFCFPFVHFDVELVDHGAHLWLQISRLGVMTPSPVAAIYQFERAQDPGLFEPLQFERITPLPTVNQRQEIAIRLTAFRATQAKFQREREAYSVATLNRARAGKLAV